MSKWSKYQMAVFHNVAKGKSHTIVEEPNSLNLNMGEPAETRSWLEFAKATLKQYADVLADVGGQKKEPST